MEFDLTNDLEITHNPGSSKKKGVNFFLTVGGGGGGVWADFNAFFNLISNNFKSS